MTWSPPKGPPPPDAITVRVRFQRELGGWGDTNIGCPALPGQEPEVVGLGPFLPRAAASVKLPNSSRPPFSHLQNEDNYGLHLLWLP